MWANQALLSGSGSVGASASLQTPILNRSLLQSVGLTLSPASEKRERDRLIPAAKAVGSNVLLKRKRENT